MLSHGERRAHARINGRFFLIEMAPEHRRADRVAEAIREEVATFLANDAKDPRISRLVTVTGCEVTRDLRHAKVFVSVMGTDAERAQTFEGLASVATHLRARVGRALRLRLAPEIVFRPDESIARAARIEDLLASIKPTRPATPSDGDSDEG
jgi:ribosome-binding factor A